MYNFYENKLSNATNNAQYNLEGRTHYVDPDTLRFHKSRILYAEAHDSGLLFSLVESHAADPHNRKRGFRGVVFDITGCVVYQGYAHTTRKQAEKALAEYLASADVAALTRAASERLQRQVRSDVTRIEERLAKLKE